MRECQPSLSYRQIFRTWWPLAASWLLMACEQPLVNAVVARLPSPEVNLAAWGGIVFPLSLIVEAPIIMLLAASTALCRDQESFLRVRRYMMLGGGGLTLVHGLVALTPLFSLVAGKAIRAPEEVLGPARVGLVLMLPWSWSIAYRRFHQGVLIRFGHSRAVGVGTLIRLTAETLVLGLGYALRFVSGTAIAGLAISSGVIAEALYAGLRARPVIRHEVRTAPRAAAPVTLRSFLSFYIPLSLTSLLYMLVQPLGSAALSRMPEALASLAVWPVMSGLVFLFRSLGMAYNEVVVALIDRPVAVPRLRRFAWGLAGASSAALFGIALTPLARTWFSGISALSPELTALALRSVALAVPMPALNALQSYYQGALVNSGRTRGITEAMGIFLLTSAFVLAAGVAWGRLEGLPVGLAAFSLGGTFQTLWLWYRSRSALRALREQAKPVYAPGRGDIN